MTQSNSSHWAVIDFPPFQLDLRAGQLCRDGVPVPLRPKTFAVLRSLAERAGELVTKQALLDAVWSDLAVSEDVVRLSVGELRAALGDERAAPRFIETVSRRGYRFIARMGAARMDASRDVSEAGIDGSAATGGPVVGRRRERGEIAGWLEAAASGRRQVGFVTGEAGIGKTTLVDTVLRDLLQTSTSGFRIARGQCVEQYGGGEPYLPLLEALASLCRGPDRPEIETLLRTQAPDWLSSVIGLLGPGNADPTGRPANTPEHTLYRLAGSLDALAAKVPLVLVLEDVHWSDFSTLDLLSVVARRRQPARLLVLCTLRPAEAIARAHPVTGVKRELQRKGLCREILLGGLSAADVASYLAARFQGADLPGDLLPLLVDRSDGNPFFLVVLVDYLLEQRLLVEKGNRWRLDGGFETLRTAIPDGLRAVIAPLLDRLSPNEILVLEAGSAAGMEFAAHAVACVTPQAGDVESVEQVCEALVRRQEILRSAGESAWPGGTSSARYAFRHVLYQQVIYQRLSSSTRQRLHRGLGDTLEAAYGGHTREVASELAAHFERARDIDRAVLYHAAAAVHARLRSANQETNLHLQTALDLIRSQPETAERLQQQMTLLHDLGSTLFTTNGYGDPSAARAFTEYATSGQRVNTTFFGMLLTEAHLANRDATSAREVVDGALSFASETEERLHEPELYRLKGECILAGAGTRGQKAEAATYFERALGIAAERKAALLELRAAISSSRVHNSGRQRLADVVGRFGSEDDCADLRAAQLLLNAEPSTGV
jgi:DNA-binding winged helix-turn-helix (wHTH) protein